MTHFTSLIRASLVVAVVVASIVSNSNVAAQYMNGTTILASCASFSILAGTAITFGGAQTIVTTSSVGVFPGTSITGNLSLDTNYMNESASISAQNCAANVATAYAYLKNLTCNNTLASADLSGVTLLPGIYCTASGVFILTATALYLDAQGDVNAQFIFQTASTVITAASTSIILINGTLAKNIYWQVGSSVTLGASSSFIGQILAYASITVGTAVTVVGRLYAQAAVTCAGAASITLPSRY